VYVETAGDNLYREQSEQSETQSQQPKKETRDTYGTVHTRYITKTLWVSMGGDDQLLHSSSYCRPDLHPWFKEQTKWQ